MYQTITWYNVPDVQTKTFGFNFVYDFIESEIIDEIWN